MPVCPAPLSHGKGVVWAQQAYCYCIHVLEDTEAQQDITCQGHTATCGAPKLNRVVSCEAQALSAVTPSHNRVMKWAFVQLESDSRLRKAAGALDLHSEQHPTTEGLQGCHHPGCAGLHSIPTTLRFSTALKSFYSLLPSSLSSLRVCVRFEREPWIQQTLINYSSST